tara:strand:- start:5553 stop:6038 length:486 start_codon:yes stop_codon:yes gene_type:complete
MSLNLTKQRITSAKGRVDRFIDQNLVTWATEEILLPGHTDIQKSVSNRAAEGLKLEKSGFMKIDLVWEFIVDNKPVHLYLEYGTKPHTITPKGKDHGGADVLHWKGPSGGFVIGQDHFASLVRHPGTQPKKLIEGIKDERLPKLQERIIREVNNFMEIDAL